jgi:pimeloyl-ACP methyl ester carboxylesterase
MLSPMAEPTDFPPAHLVTLPDRGFGDIELSVHRAGDGPAVIFSHGFPELAYSWRDQIPAVAAAGFTAIAPDQRGYGGSSAPEAIEAYDLEQLCGDLAGLCKAEGFDRAVFVGHDWGGGVVWAMPYFQPDVVAGVVGVCTPQMRFPTTQTLAGLVNNNWDDHYMLWFQQPGVAEAVLDPRAAMVFDKLMRGGVDMTELVEAFSAGTISINPFKTIEELQPLGAEVSSPEIRRHYSEVFTRTGFRGGINWYRNMDRNAALHPDHPGGDPGVPCLMLLAEWDPALPPSLADGMSDRIADLETHLVERAGHWVQQECPDRVNELLVDWLTRRFG